MSHKISKSLANDNKAVFCSINKADKVTGIRLSAIDVARIVKKWAATVDFDITKFAGHSLRRGFVTSAVTCGIRNHIIMKTTRHKSSKMIDDYTSDNSLFVSPSGTSCLEHLGHFKLHLEHSSMCQCSSGQPCIFLNVMCFN